MLQLKAFAIFDKKAIAYRFPHFYHQVGQAIRAFEDAVNDPQTEFAKHPSDFVLCQIGEFDDQSGIITGLKSPINIQEALTLKAPKTEN